MVNILLCTSNFLIYRLIEVVSVKIKIKTANKHLFLNLYAYCMCINNVLVIVHGKIYILKVNDCRWTEQLYKITHNNLKFAEINLES